jgi:quercetin dioxygenase-like cupin family protein
VTVRVLGASATCRVDAASTRGAFALFELILPPGCTVPPHRHPAEDEVCYVVDGRVRIAVARHRATYGPGGCVVVPRGTRHALATVGGAPATLLVVVSPAAGDGRVFAELAAGFATGPEGSPTLADAVWRIARTHGVERAARHPRGAGGAGV